MSSSLSKAAYDGVVASLALSVECFFGRGPKVGRPFTAGSLASPTSFLVLSASTASVFELSARASPCVCKPVGASDSGAASDVLVSDGPSILACSSKDF